jgi:arginyl-tRNA--protein-N-Asp/Glu arginylyltransferase
MNSPAENLKVYATYPHDCSYIAGRQATTVFIDPEARVTQALYSRLSEHGFRRSGAHIYKPHCKQCSACIPCRVPLASFTPNRTQRKLLNRNRDLELQPLGNIDNDASYRLYHDYICQRHGDGDMYPPSREQYASFLSNEHGLTRYLGFTLDGKLVAVAVVDQLDNALSAVYTFFDHQLERRSLGTWAILRQIELAREMGLNYLYLGYWIKESQKMAYKAAFRPLQIFRDGHWISAPEPE